MAAGLGFKDFVTGEVLTANDVDGYLMQGIWVFANAAARTAAVTSPQEGNYSFLKDTNSTEYYDGSAWVAAGGGGGSGANWSLLNAGGTTLSGSSVTVSGITGKDKIMVILEDADTTATEVFAALRFNSDSGANYQNIVNLYYAQSSYSHFNSESESNMASTEITMQRTSNNSNSGVNGQLIMTGCNASGVKAFQYTSGGSASGGASAGYVWGGGIYTGSSTISSVTALTLSSSFAGGKIYVYTSA